MSWFSDLFGRDDADEVELALLTADHTNPYEHLTLEEMRGVLDDREALREAEPTYDCEMCSNTARVDCEECEHASGLDNCPTCDGATAVRCRWCRGSGERSGEDCEDCDGTGVAVCPECDGSGLVRCSVCLGDGWVDCPVECWARSPDGRFYD